MKKKMKINTKVVPLKMLKNKLLAEVSNVHIEYSIGFTRFIEEFFNAMEVFDVIDGGEISTSDCTEHAIERVKRHCKLFSIHDEKAFYRGTVDACQKTFQILELGYSDIQVA